MKQNRAQEVLRWLPVIRKIIKLGGTWQQLRGICEPLGLTDTAFRDNPHLGDYLVSHKTWRKRTNK